MVDEIIFVPKGWGIVAQEVFDETKRLNEVGIGHPMVQTFKWGYRGWAQHSVLTLAKLLEKGEG